MSSSSGSGSRGTGKSRTAPVSDGGKTLKIGEAAKMVGVAPFVLRFWETQFSFLKPHHTQSGHRYYLEKDIETLKAVKRLLHKERFTIEGAKKYIREKGLEAALKGGPATARRKINNRVQANTNTNGASTGTEVEAFRRTFHEVRRELELIREKLQ
ncbi:MAG: MerR family transcriptional regulator [Candidatus Binataceae bacterium]|nr:MerR family transcriptional regulator [Candidatus Binataceae bacterium]